MLSRGSLRKIRREQAQVRSQCVAVKYSILERRVVSEGESPREEKLEKRPYVARNGLGTRCRLPRARFSSFAPRHFL